MCNLQRIHEEYGAIFDHLFRQHQKSSKQVRNDNHDQIHEEKKILKIEEEKKKNYKNNKKTIMIKIRQHQKSSK